METIIFIIIHFCIYFYFLGSRICWRKKLVFLCLLFKHGKFSSMVYVWCVFFCLIQFGNVSVYIFFSWSFTMVWLLLLWCWGIFVWCAVLLSDSRNWTLYTTEMSNFDFFCALSCKLLISLYSWWKFNVNM